VEKFNQLLDAFSEFLAARRGLVPLLGISLVVLNAVLRYFGGGSWIAQSDLLLHIGIVVSVLGLMLAWAL
jgi:hypothetical protein